jgi:O-antigen/teichoic acid export membrane protein
VTNEPRLTSVGDSAGEAVSDPPRIPLPEGTIPVAIGLVISGVASYAFFKVGQQALGKEDFKPIVALWFTTFALVPGFFMPVEQEVGRALAHRRALNQGGRPVVQKVLPLMLGMLALLMIVVVAASGWITNDLFEGYGLVTLALVFAFMSYAPFHLARGICSGSGRFPPYGLLMGLDGITRTAGCIVLWLAGVDAVGAYALVVVLAPLVGIVVVLSMGSLRTDDGPPAEFSEITPNLGWLLGGSILAAALVNAGPLGIDILASADEAAKVTAFGNGVLLSRVPLFLFQAVQAALLPRLARLAAKGDLGEFRTGFRHLMVVVVGVAVVGTVGSFLVGPPVLEYVYDGGLDRRTLTLLALASGLYMIALATSQAVIALQGHSFVTYGWAAGMATFLLVTAYSSDDLYLRVELGLVTASTAALIVFALGLRQRVAAGATPDAESMIDGILDNPLEA